MLQVVFIVCRFLFSYSMTKIACSILFSIQNRFLNHYFAAQRLQTDLGRSFYINSYRPSSRYHVSGINRHTSCIAKHRMKGNFISAPMFMVSTYAIPFIAYSFATQRHRSVFKQKRISVDYKRVHLKGALGFFLWL